MKPADIARLKTIDAGILERFAKLPAGCLIRKRANCVFQSCRENGNVRRFEAGASQVCAAGSGRQTAALEVQGAQVKEAHAPYRELLELLEPLQGVQEEQEVLEAQEEQEEQVVIDDPTTGRGAA